MKYNVDFKRAQMNLHVNYTKQNIQEKFFDMVSYLITMHKQTMPASSTASAEVPLGIKQCTFLSSQILKTMTM